MPQLVPQVVPQLVHVVAQHEWHDRWQCRPQWRRWQQEFALAALKLIATTAIAKLSFTNKERVIRLSLGLEALVGPARSGRPQSIASGHGAA
ncbi:MAG TPA: hypothetical protein VMF30_00490 [Pirellulales bacterium]|nr:hypothetical protein [Pirellulales bacterium]